MCGCSSEQEAIEFLHRAPRERLDWLVALSERLAPSDTCWRKMKGKRLGHCANSNITQSSSSRLEKDFKDDLQPQMTDGPPEVK